jgi:surfeit locus 1 family protein
MLAAMFGRRWLLATVLVLAGGAVCIRLGIWQLDRLAQRRAANAHFAAMQAVPPLFLPGDSAQDLPALEFRAIEASGRYDFSQQVVLLNQVYQDRYGYHLLTPLVFADGSAVLVDRGWIPADGNPGRAAWAAYDEPAVAEVTGIVRASRSQADIGGRTDPPLNPGQPGLDAWLFPNIPRLQEQMTYRLLPVYIQLDPVPGDVQPPIAYQVEVEITEGPHLGYAMQWFSFAAILLIGYPFYIRRHSHAGSAATIPLEQA